MAKKILIISTAFPPRIGSGSKRLFSIANNLSDLGWEVFVLTLKKGYYPFREEDLDLVSSKIKVFRTKMVIPKQKLLMALAHLFLAPDRFLAWYPLGVKKGLEIIKKEDIDIIYSSAPSFSVHLLAKKLKEKSNKRWVAEFRDPWTKNILFYKKSFIKKIIEKRMERSVFEKSDLVISVAPHMTRLNKEAYGKSSDKFHTITNGFNSIENKKQNSIFTITYTGTKYPFFKEAFNDFFNAVNDLIKKGLIEKEKIIINVYDKKNWIDHKKVLEKQLESSVLLLIGANPQKQEYLSAKIYEYLAAKRPILAIDEIDSPSDKIIRKTNTGKTVIGKENTAEAVLKYYNDFYSGGIPYNPNQEEVEKYNYLNISKKLDSLL